MLIGAALCGLLASSAQAADAPQATAPVAPAPALAGPVIAGICILSQQSLVGRSKIGAAATAHLRELAQVSQSEFDAEKVRLENRGKALNAKRATLAPAQLQAQGLALNQRIQALQAEAATRSRQLDDTRGKAVGRIVEAAQPFIAQAYAAHGCGLLIAREAVLGGNPANDLTGEVLTAMDAKAAPLSFGLEPANGASR